MFVKPTPGLTFRDPATRIRVPTEGMEVPDGDLNWARLINDGDAVVCDPPKAEPEPAPGPEAQPAPAPPAKAKAPAADASNTQ